MLALRATKSFSIRRQARSSAVSSLAVEKEATKRPRANKQREIMVGCPYHSEIGKSIWRLVSEAVLPGLTKTLCDFPSGLNGFDPIDAFTGLKIVLVG